MKKSSFITRFFIVLLIPAFVSSCALYTKSNVREMPKKENMGELNVEEYKDVSDGYHSHAITFPFLVFSPQFTAIHSYVPLGPELFLSNSKIGHIEGHAYYLAEAWPLYSDDDVTFPTIWNDKPRIEYRFIYSYPIWKTIEPIDKFQMSIGTEDRKHYIGYLPTKVSLESHLRLGFDKNFSFFRGTGLTDRLTENDPELVEFYDENEEFGTGFMTSNGSIKMGISFQRMVSTRFKTMIDGYKFHTAKHHSQGVYFDISYLILPDNTVYDFEYWALTADEFGQPLYDHREQSLSVSDILEPYKMGFSLGYKIYGHEERKVFPAGRFRAEIGLNPGYYYKRSNGFFARIGVGFGFGSK